MVLGQAGDVMRNHSGKDIVGRTLRRKEVMSITDELNELITLHGNCRDALNVTLAKLRVAQDRIAVLEEAAQQSVQADKCPHCQNGLIVLPDKSIIDCIACGSTGIRR